MILKTINKINQTLKLKNKKNHIVKLGQSKIINCNFYYK